MAWRIRAISPRRDKRLGLLVAAALSLNLLPLFVCPANAVVAQAKPALVNQAPTAKDGLINYAWNVVANQNQMVVAVNYQGKIGQLAPQCAKKEPRYPYQLGGIMRLKDGWLAASLRSRDALDLPAALALPQTDSANSIKKIQLLRGYFDRLLLWKGAGGGNQNGWQLAAALTPPPNSPGKGKKPMTHFADSLALADGATGRLVVGVVDATTPRDEPFALVYERRDDQGWSPAATLPTEEGAGQQASGLCLATNKDFVILGHPTGGVGIYEKLKGVDSAGMQWPDMQWRRRGIFGFGCEQAAFIGNQAISLSNGRLYGLHQAMPAWREGKAAVIYRDQAGLNPFEEQLAVGDNLIIASDNLRQTIHLYIRDAQVPGSWLQQTTLSRHMGNAANQGVAGEARAFGRRLALTDRQLLVVDRTATAMPPDPMQNEKGDQDPTASEASDQPTALASPPFADQIQVFERNPVDGLWSFKTLLTAQSLQQGQKLAVMTLNPQSCQPEIASTPEGNSGRQNSGDHPVLGVLYALPTP